LPSAISNQFSFDFLPRVVAYCEVIRGLPDPAEE
jgi:hypothetical protein